MMHNPYARSRGNHDIDDARLDYAQAQKMKAAAPDMVAALRGFKRAWTENRLLTSDEAAALLAALEKATD